MRRNARYHPKMADSGITKRALAASFKELLDEQTFTQISIGEICALCEMNRKSFYYHFRDKHDLINWIFDSEFEKYLSRKATDDPLLTLCTYFYENRAFYKKIFKIEGQNSFIEHLERVITPRLIVGVRETAENDSEAEFFASVLADSLISAVRRWLGEREIYSPDHFCTLFRRAHDTVSVVFNCLDS